MKLLMLLMLSGCSIFFGSPEAPKSAKGARYSITFARPGWVYQQDKRSDYVFKNKEDGRIILSNSFCEEFQEQPLEQLAKKTFRTIDDFKSDKGSYTTFQHREAYDLEGMGSVDGVKVNLKLLNTRRDNCYFDFLAISPQGTKPDNEAFTEFLETVRFH
jgi:hypothetical protein